MVYELIYNGTFAWLGTITLLILSFQDLRTMTINDRKNLIMLGVSIGMVGIFQPSLLYLLAIIAFNFLFIQYIKFSQIMADGDTSALGWIMLGFGIIGVTSLIWFLIILAALSVIPFIIKWIIKYEGDHFPYYPVITAAFIITCAMFGVF